LCFRIVVHDRDRAQRLVRPREPPLLLEHRQYLLPDRLGIRRSAQILVHLRATFELRAAHRRAQHRAARVGVDLDELRSVRADVEVVPEENAACGLWLPCNGRRHFERRVAPGRQFDDAVHHIDHRLHGIDIVARDLHWQLRKHAVVGGIRGQAYSLADSSHVGADAIAAPVFKGTDGRDLACHVECIRDRSFSHGRGPDIRNSTVGIRSFTDWKSSRRFHVAAPAVTLCPESALAGS
jgi:hypothetical protein